MGVRPCVCRRVAVWRVVAAPDMATRKADAKVKPLPAGPKAVLAAVDGLGQLRHSDLIEVRTARCSGHAAEKTNVQAALGTGSIVGTAVLGCRLVLSIVPAMTSYAADIKPLFRERDREAMLSAFDLWLYDDVVAHKDGILAQLSAGDMPCDGAWPKEHVELFRAWTADGTPA